MAVVLDESTMEQISDQTAVAIQEDAVVVGDRLSSGNPRPRKFVVEEYKTFNFFTCKETTRYVYSNHLSNYELVATILMAISIVIATPLTLVLQHVSYNVVFSTPPPPPPSLSL